MNEEILKTLKNYEKRYKFYNETHFIIAYIEIRELLDYITNLQQENKQMQNNWNELKEWLEEKMSVYEYQEASNFYIVLNKIQELEGKNE